MKTTLVAFCGAKESGKSTSATFFKDMIKSLTEERAFAGHLKVVCSKVFNIGMEYFLDPKLKEVELETYVILTRENIEKVLELFEIATYDYDKHVRPHVGQVFDTPRKVLQYVGTEILHPVDPLIHVNYALKKVNPDVVTLITDLRFPQEFDALYGREDFLPVYVHNIEAEARAASDSHPSERGWQKFKDKCIKLDNNESIEDLKRNLKELINTYYKE